MKIESIGDDEMPSGRLSYEETSALARRISQVQRRVDRTFPTSGALAADLILLWRILGRVEVDAMHGSTAGYRDTIEKSLLCLIDRADLVRSAFTVERYHGRPSIEIEAIKPNGNGAELHQ